MFVFIDLDRIYGGDHLHYDHVLLSGHFLSDQPRDHLNVKDEIKKTIVFLTVSSYVFILIHV